MKQMKSSNLDIRDLFDKKIVVVGKKTMTAGDESFSCFTFS